MASKNNLLGSGKVFESLKEEVKEEIKEDVKEEVVPIEEVKEEVKKDDFTPCWRYHSTCPQGRIVTSEEELKYLESIGWKLMIPR